jgi:hypothetical protein
MTLLAGGTENAADAVEEPAASKSPAIPSAIAVFCTTRLSLSAVGDVSTVAHHRAYLSRISIIYRPARHFPVKEKLETAPSGEVPIRARNGMAAVAGTPVLPEDTDVGALPAH